MTEDMNLYMCDLDQIEEEEGKLGRLKAELAEVNLWNECAREENKTLKELFKYIAEENVGGYQHIIETLNDCSHFMYMGYIKVTKRIGAKQELLLDFVVPNVNNLEGYVEQKYTATWQPSDNYGVYQTRCFEDDWHGFLLLPTYNVDEYLLMSFAD